jgi:hypothetical protein
MMRSTADAKADLERFVRRVAEHDQVWLLRGKTGPAVCQSNEFDDEHGNPALVLLFFSDRAYAARVQGAQYAKHRPEAIALFDFLFRWLPGMTGDGRLAGPNWSAELTGCEVDPFALRESIEAAMTPEHRAQHQARFAELAGDAED